MSEDYGHYGRCFKCGELTALNEQSLMCEQHDYLKEITHLKKLLKEAVPWVNLMLEDPCWKHLEGKDAMQWKDEVEKLK